MVTLDRDESRAKVVFVVCGALLLAFLSARLIHLSRIADVREFPDTGSYAQIAARPVLSQSFLAAERPFVLPLIYKLLKLDFDRVAVAQTLLSILSWGLLAILIARTVEWVWLKPFAFSVILLLGLSQNVAGWDTVMLSESIALSLMVLLLAGWLWLWEGWQWRKAIFLIIVAFFWTFSRESNAWGVMTMALLTFVAGIRKPLARRSLFGLSGLLATLFIANEVSSNLGQRWVFPFQNVLAQRILPSPKLPCGKVR